MQMLCRLLEQVIARCLWLALALWVLSAPTQAATAVVVPAQPEINPHEVMQAAVKKWVAREQGVGAEQVELAPLDARLKVRACDKPLSMDLPFSSPESVRVRCSQPAWQLYVRVSLTSRAMLPVAQTKTERLTPAPVAKRHMLVATQLLQHGTTLSEAHVSRVEVDTGVMPVNALESLADIRYAELVRDVPAGTPIRSLDIRPLVLVKRGQLVMMSVGQPQAFQISARVEALQDGRLGEQIKLKNPESGRQLTGLVQGPNQVRGL